MLAYTRFPAQHRTKLHSTNSLERLNKEVSAARMSSDIYPNEDAIVRLIGAVMFQQDDVWQSQMQVEALAQIYAAKSDLLRSIPTQAT